MASIRNAAQNVLDIARDGIGWITLWKSGRSWESDYIYLDEKRDGTVELDHPEDLDELQRILAIDPHAIIVNSWHHNLAVVEDYVTRDDLANALRWQYDLQNAQLADFMEYIVQPAQDTAADAEQIATNDLDEMHKTEDEELSEWGRQERAVTLTNDQWSRLVTYLLQTTKHRTGERDAWLSLAEEKNPDGSQKFENAPGNAAYWQEVIDDLDAMLPKLDGMEA